MNKILVLICLISIGYTSVFSQNRPKEAWVFRSVLDKRARVITVALNKELYVAYDGNNGGIFKIWKDGVNYSGTIWDTKHGPQPLSNGRPYTEGIVDEQVWFLSKNGTKIPSIVQFKGYVWKNNKVTFKYEIKAENQIAYVEETPEYIFKSLENLPGLERKIKITAPEGYDVYTTVKYNNLSKITDLTTDGTLKMISKTENYLDWATLLDIKANITLKNNALTTISVYYSPKVIQ